MWDVKQTMRYMWATRREFYLDYVGCKGYYNNQRWAYRRSFISTMWDVKFVEGIQWHSAMIQFYLDYVGCKE